MSKAQKRAIQIVVAAAVAWFLFFGLPAIRDRHAFNRGCDWIIQAEAELRAATNAPPVSTNAAAPEWITGTHVVFSNGWAAYRVHSVHDSDGLADMALLRGSDGRLFFSTKHFCSGNISMELTDSNLPAPADLEEFLRKRAARQEWQPFPDGEGQVRCLVIQHPGPSLLRPKTSRNWVWISVNEAGKSRTLLAQPFKVHRGLSWESEGTPTNAARVSWHRAVWDENGVPIKTGPDRVLEFCRKPDGGFELARDTGR